jgi:hypothetical protein
LKLLEPVIQSLRHHYKRLALGLLLITIVPQTLAARQKIQFSCLAASGSSAYQQLEALYTKSFAELNIDFTMVSLPEPEILKSFEQGKFDGDCARLSPYISETFKQHYRLLDTPPADMEVTIFGTRDIINQPLDTLMAATQPKSEFLRGLARHYQIKLHPQVNTMDDVWQLMQSKDINAFIGISRLFPHKDPAVQKLKLKPRNTLAKFPLHVALHHRWQHIQPMLERILTRNIQSQKQSQRQNKKQPRKTEITSPKNTAQATGSASDKGTIIFGCPIGANTTVFTDIEHFYRQAFAKLGMGFQMREMSRSREAHALITGHIDGSCARLHVPASKTPPIRVPILVSEETFEVWSTRLQPLITSLNDIPAQSRLAFRQGLITPEQMLAAPHIRFLPQPLSPHSLTVLSRNQTDYAADIHIQIEQNIGNIQVRHPLFYSGHLGKVEAAPYLSYKHQALLKPFVESLREIIGPYKTINNYIYRDH